MTENSKKLLDRLVDDYSKTLPKEQRKFDKKNGSSYIYNLFRGKYNFSYKEFREIFNFLIQQNNEPTEKHYDV
jgi:hypothetical protein